MTTEEKAKAYDEALERARKIHNEILDNEILGFPDQIREIFPELRGSEDERIRKWLADYFSSIKKTVWVHRDITCEQILDWLEKQKEHKWSPSEGEMGVLYKLCYISNQITDEDDTELTRLYQDLKREHFNGHSFENMFPSEKQKEQKPVVTHGETYHVDTLGTQQVIAGKMPQKPAEWSEEDEERIQRIYHFLWKNRKGDTDTIYQIEKDADWLKSLRPDSYKNCNSRWKPSEEQMEELWNVISYIERPSSNFLGVPALLESLYEQLKKL